MNAYTALATGFIPEGWTVVSDDPESSLDFDRLTYRYLNIPANLWGMMNYDICSAFGESSIGWIDLKKLIETEDILGSLGFAKIVLDRQGLGNNTIAKELGKDRYILCTRTVLKDTNGAYRIGALWGDGQRLVLNFCFLGLRFDSRATFVSYLSE